MDDALFVNILVEPDKEFVRNFKEGDDCPRNLKIRGIDSQPDGGFVAILDVVAKKIAKVDRYQTKPRFLIAWPKYLQLRS